MSTVRLEQKDLRLQEGFSARRKREERSLSSGTETNTFPTLVCASCACASEHLSFCAGQKLTWHGTNITAFSGSPTHDGGPLAHQQPKSPKPIPAITHNSRRSNPPQATKRQSTCAFPNQVLHSSVGRASKCQRFHQSLFCLALQLTPLCRETATRWVDASLRHK